MKIAESLAENAHRALEELSLAGAFGEQQSRILGFRRLAADARAIGLFDLSDKLDDVARALSLQANLGDKPNAALAEALLASYDRVQALGAELARMALLRAFGAHEEASS